MGKLNSKIVNEYDVKGKNRFAKVFDMRRKNKTTWKKIQRWFAVNWQFIRIKYYDYKSYFKNLIRFNKAMKQYRPWDYQYQVNLFAYGLEILANNIDKFGNEVASSRKKKVAAIRELIGLLRNGYEDEVNDKYLGAGDENVITHVTEYADGSVGFQTIDEESIKIQKASYNRYKEAKKKARDAYYDRIFHLLKGQNIQDEFGEQLENETLEEYAKRWDKFYEEHYDGSGIEGWWD